MRVRFALREGGGVSGDAPDRGPQSMRVWGVSLCWSSPHEHALSARAVQGAGGLGARGTFAGQLRLTSLHGISSQPAPGERKPRRSQPAPGASGTLPFLKVSSCFCPGMFHSTSGSIQNTGCRRMERGGGRRRGEEGGRGGVKWSQIGRAHV